MDERGASADNGDLGGGIDAKQRAALLKLKASVADILRPGYPLHEDSQLLKYLTARRYDVKKAELMFRQSMEFREKMRSDYILNEFKAAEVLLKYMTGGIACFDRDGCPVRIEKFGNLDTKGMVYSCHPRELERFKIFEQEHALLLMRQQSAKLGKKVDKLVVIMDLDNISTKQLWRPGLQLYLNLVKLLEDNYPEFVKRLIVVNAPRIFPMFYKVCKPLISEDMRKKLLVLGSEYKEDLLKLISSEELPAFLGGQQTDPDGDPRCISKIRWGGTIPESCYLKDLVDMDKMTSGVIAAGNKLTLDFQVNSKGSVLRWEFTTDDYDIAFGVRRAVQDGSSYENVIPVERVKSHVVPEDGSFLCEDCGVYQVIFDNSYSWSRAKKLWYSIEVLDSEPLAEAEDEEEPEEESSFL